MKILLLYFLVLVTIVSCKNNLPEESALDKTPPKAELKEKIFEEFGNTRIDNYYWMNQREDTAVINYLTAENNYFDAMMAHSEPLQNTIYEEMKGRLNENEQSAPFFSNGYWYYTRYETGNDYPLYCRKKESLDANEEIMLDANEMADGYSYFAIGSWRVSPDNSKLMYAVDTVSRRKYTIYFKNLSTGEISDEVLPLANPNFTWANDNKTLFYSSKDENTLRWDKIHRYQLGNPDSDEVIYKESDETYSAYVTKSASGKYIFMASGSTLSTEYHHLSADDPLTAPKVFAERSEDEIYDIEHQDGRFLIRTNQDAINFKIMECAEDETSRANWKEVIAHRENTLIRDVTPFANNFVVTEQSEGKTLIRVYNNSEMDHDVEFPEEAYRVYTSGRQEFKSDFVRLNYSSLTTPNTIYHHSFKEKENEQIWQKEVMDPTFSPDNYVSERVMATSHDEVEVPISLVYKKGARRSEGNPTLLYGYGSYGATMDPSFNSERLSLLDRGFVYAIAHIRGGQMMGRDWYEDGKMFNKKNTFLDFIACGDHLIEKGYVTDGQLYGMGGSAGGLLIGAVINMRPDLFDGVIAAVPFVDVITTMSDPTIPLTTGEYKEWGNPGVKEEYDYILSYSPYDNVKEMEYPNILITTGLHDSQVQYFEPAKWAAKLREYNTSDNIILLRTNMDAGHGGASGRYKRLKERAMYFSFVIGLAEDKSPR